MIIEATNIHKSFGSLEVLKGIDLTVAPPRDHLHRWSQRRREDDPYSRSSAHSKPLPKVLR